MSRTPNQPIEFNTFVAGIVTEAGPLTFPPNASLDEQNFSLNRDGSRQRRLGMAEEQDAVWTSVVGKDLADGTVAQTYRWEGAGGSGLLDIVIVQIGTRLYLFDGGAEDISKAPLNGGNYINTGADNDFRMSFATLFGMLIVSRGSEDFVIVEYDVGNDSVSTSTQRLECRDLFGIAEDIPVDERPEGTSLPFQPKVLDSVHDYNLRNQGWPLEALCLSSAWGNGSTREDPVYHMSRKGGTTNGPGLLFPSNADVFWAGKTTAGEDISGIGGFSPWDLGKAYFGATQAPRGAAIIDVFNRGVSRGAFRDLVGYPQDESKGFISDVASYAGRVFYSVVETDTIGTDDNTPTLSAMVFYSQVGTSIDKLSKCHGHNNPTAEDINDPLATDGGFVTIPEAGRIVKLVPLGDSLFVIATNGVWEIHGGEGTFSATAQNLSKASNVGANGPSSVVVSEETLSYWSKGGIYQVRIDPVSLRGSASNITQATIQTLYDEIPDFAKAFVTGSYDSVSRQLRWLYRSASTGSQYTFDRELVFDLNLNAFYQNTIGQLPIDPKYVSGYIETAGVIFNNVTELVTVDGVTVTSGGEDVTTTGRQVDEGVRGSTKYLVVDSSVPSTVRFTFGNYSNPTFNDWAVWDSINNEYVGGIDSPAYLLTGYLTGGDSQMNKQATYLTAHFRSTEQGFEEIPNQTVPEYRTVGESSCFVQAQWEWTNNADYGRWSRKFQAYRISRTYVTDDVNDAFAFGTQVTSSKSKLRGKGRALSLLFETEPNKDCHLYGWGLNISAETTA